MQNPVNSSIRLASRSSAPSRELIAFSPGAVRFFNSSAPVAFASDDEKNAPVRFNDRPYRGRIEVFTNLRGTLTVVNEARPRRTMCGALLPTSFRPVVIPP